MALRIMQSSRELVHVPITGPDRGDLVAAQLRVTVGASSGSTWITPESYDPATGDLSFLVGPGSATGILPAGLHRVFVDVVDYPERPILVAGRLYVEPDNVGELVPVQPGDPGTGTEDPWLRLTDADGGDQTSTVFVLDADGGDAASGSLADLDGGSPDPALDLDGGTPSTLAFAGDADGGTASSVPTTDYDGGLAA